jgi:hypothetical protein
MQSTNIFQGQLERLKKTLGVKKDQEAAKALGLSKAALSARKARGVFPEKELYTLSAKRPELALDVLYILTGERREGLDKAATAMFEAMTTSDAVEDMDGEERAGFYKSMGRAVRNQKDDFPMASEPSTGHGDRRVLSRRAAALLDNYEHLSEDDKRNLEGIAFSLAKQVKGKAA